MERFTALQVQIVAYISSKAFDPLHFKSKLYDYISVSASLLASLQTVLNS